MPRDASAVWGLAEQDICSPSTSSFKAVLIERIIVAPQLTNTRTLPNRHVRYVCFIQNIVHNQRNRHSRLQSSHMARKTPRSQNLSVVGNALACSAAALNLHRKHTIPFKNETKSQQGTSRRNCMKKWG
jgi:hypothetical protein